jgi:hypothetical protein
MWQIDLRYAAAAARPTEIQLDGKILKADAASQITGSWTPDGQKWFVEAAVPITAGKHVLRLENDGPFPHIDKIVLGLRSDLPVEPADSAKDSEPLEPEYLTSWARFLTAQKEVDGSPFRVWWKVRAGEAIEPKTPLETALIADLTPAEIDLPHLAERIQDIYEQPVPETAALKAAIDSKTGPYSLGERADETFSDAVVAQLKVLNEKEDEIKKRIPPLPEALSITEGKPQNLRIHLRGSHTTLGEEVGRRMPRVFSHEEPLTIPDEVSGRLELARWLTQPDHPLTARVLVNRIWQAHFGEGLVRSPDNFGKLGDAPTHPELLDWLATEFVRSGWSIKQLHRLILNSATWQKSTDWNESAASIDPENMLWWRMSRRRLEAEAVRDSLLAVAGRLDATMFGEPVKTVTKPSGEVVPEKELEAAGRRSVYQLVRRNTPQSLLNVFDAPVMEINCARRASTTSATQALALMNGEFVTAQAEHFARRILEGVSDDGGRVRQAFRIALARDPSAAEMDRLLTFARAQESFYKDLSEAERRVRVFRDLCQALLGTNEFIYLD